MISSTFLLLLKLRMFCVIVLNWILGKLFSSHRPTCENPACSIDWVSSISKKGSFDGKKVTQVVQLTLDGNRGFVGQMSKVRIELEGENAPVECILKLSPSGVHGRMNSSLQGNAREASLYHSKELASVNKLRPKAYFAHGNRFAGEYCLLMEDMSARNAIGVNMIMGNQIWGIPKPLDPPRDALETLKLIYRTIAGMHAQFWNDPKLLQIPFLKAHDWYQGKGRSEWETGLEVSKQSWQAGKRKWMTEGTGVKFSDRFVSIMDKSFENSSWENLQAHVKDKSIPFTLCHGDFHSSNMVFVPGSTTSSSENDRIVMFDWSEVGPWEPSSELAQILISDVKPELFTKHSKELIKLYWDTLIEKGVSKKDYPWEQCWNTFIERGVERWIWLFAIMNAFPLPGRGIQYFHDQIMAFIDHHCPSKDHFVIKTLAIVMV